MFYKCHKIQLSKSVSEGIFCSDANATEFTYLPVSIFAAGSGGSGSGGIFHATLAGHTLTIQLKATLNFSFSGLWLWSAGIIGGPPSYPTTH